MNERKNLLLYILITFLYFNAPAQQREAIPVSLVPIPQSVVIDKVKRTFYKTAAFRFLMASTNDYSITPIGSCEELMLEPVYFLRKE